MIDLHLKVKDDEYDFVVNLLQKFDFVDVESELNIDLTEEQKIELDRRYNEIISGTAKLMSFEEFEKIL